MNYRNILMYVGIAVIVLIALLVLWKFFSKPAVTVTLNSSSAAATDGQGQLEHFSGLDDNASGSDYRLLFFYANWCPHCKAAKPEMEKVNAELEKGPVNNKTVKLVDYDCTEPSPEMEAIMDKYNVSSYPTLLLVSQDGKVTPFENKPTKDAVMNFLTANVH